MDHFSILLQYPCPQPLADQVQYGSISGPLGQHPFQPFPPDVVEESLDVRFHHEVVSAELQLLAQVLERIVSAHPWPVAIAARQKVHFVYRQQDLRHCHLQQLVLQYWYAQRAEFPVALGYVFAPPAAGGRHRPERVAGGRARTPPEPDADFDLADLDALEDAPAGVASSPEERLLQAFPGAEEVQS